MPVGQRACFVPGRIGAQRTTLMPLKPLNTTIALNRHPATTLVKHPLIRRRRRHGHDQARLFVGTSPFVPPYEPATGRRDRWAGKRKEIARHPLVSLD